MRAGRLRHRVTFQERALIANGYGEEEEIWSDVSDRWVSIMPAKADEIAAAGTVQAQVSHTIRLRYWSAVTHQFRVVYGSRTFNIDSVRNIGERDRELELLCLEDVD